MSTQSILDNLPSKISAGASSITKTSTTVLSFPAFRGQGQNKNILASDNYKNGITFDCYTRKDAKYGTMASFRNSAKKSLNSNFSSMLSSFGNLGSASKGMDLIATISMPMSKTYERKLSHNFNSGKMSNAERGGSIGGMVSAMTSDTIANIIDKAGGNFMADNDEALAAVTRNTYGGVNNREMTYSWDLSANNMNDLVAILNIHRTFCYRSLGTVSKSSKTLKNIGDKIKSASQDLQDKLLGSMSQSQVIVPSTVDFLSQAMTISNPDIWMIQKYATGSALGEDDVFGPAQIKDISLNEVPGETFQGLKNAPNHSGKYTLSITFVELITLDRSNF